MSGDFEELHEPIARLRGRLARIGFARLAIGVGAVLILLILRTLLLHGHAAAARTAGFAALLHVGHLLEVRGLLEFGRGVRGADARMVRGAVAVDRVRDRRARDTGGETAGKADTHDEADHLVAQALANGGRGARCAARHRHRCARRNGAGGCAGVGLIHVLGHGLGHRLVRGHVGVRLPGEDRRPLRRFHCGDALGLLRVGDHRGLLGVGGDVGVLRIGAHGESLCSMSLCSLGIAACAWCAPWCYCISTPCEVWMWLKGDMEPASESLKTSWAHTIPTIATLSPPRRMSRL